MIPEFSSKTPSLDITHLVGDSIHLILKGGVHGTHLFVVVSYYYSEGQPMSFIEFIQTLELTPMVSEGVFHTVTGVLLWIYDGLPYTSDLYDESLE